MPSWRTIVNVLSLRLLTFSTVAVSVSGAAEPCTGQVEGIRCARVTHSCVKIGPTASKLLCVGTGSPQHHPQTELRTMKDATTYNGYDSAQPPFVWHTRCNLYDEHPHSSWVCAPARETRGHYLSQGEDTDADTCASKSESYLQKSSFGGRDAAVIDADRLFNAGLSRVTLGKVAAHLLHRVGYEPAESVLQPDDAEKLLRPRLSELRTKCPVALEHGWVMIDAARDTRGGTHWAFSSVGECSVSPQNQPFR